MSSSSERNSSQKEFVLSMKDNQINYLDGFKQMISHFIGISRRIEEVGKRIASDNGEEADTILSVVEDPESTAERLVSLISLSFLSTEKPIILRCK